MCGIHLQVWKEAHCSFCSGAFSDKDSNLQNRGPDSVHSFPSHHDEYHKIILHASVLQMRQELVTQPVKITEDVFLCWNGEIYETSDNAQVFNYRTSDTLLVASELRHIFEEEKDDDIIQQEISKVMSKLYNAEFGFLVLTKSSVYYGRDNWGRRSLLRYDCPKGCGSFQIVSATEILNDTGSDTEMSQEDERNSWIEMPPGLVHRTSLTNDSPCTCSTPYPQASFTSPSPLEAQFASTFQSLPPEGILDDLWSSSLQLEFHLRRAVQMRLDHHAPSAVLFSGGLDSAVVAAIAAELTTQPLFLYNVSFGPSFMKSADRKAALVTAEALQQKYPNKKIIYQDIIVDWEDICTHEPHIRILLQPKTTLMDVNIGIALWFASRGRLDSTEADDDNDVIPTPRVLLLGMGADEQMGKENEEVMNMKDDRLQFGGYGRHRKAFDRDGWKGLKEELEMDQARFWERNLGRDDRMCADHGKEARFPFLDAHVVRLLKQLPLSQICDFSLPPGQGDKRILRLVASRIGLDHASGLVKRAIQFGSRISHLSDAKRFGSRRKAKGGASVKPNK